MTRIALITILLTAQWSLTGQSRYRTACQGNLERLDSLLEATPINEPDDRGRSLLHWAVACRQNEIVDYLINKGIAINSEDHEGATPMYMAVRFNNDTLFDRLMDLQKSSEWKKLYGASLLEKAILNQSLPFVQKLIGLGVAIDIKNKRGSTPLEIATKTKADEISEWLLSAGADQNMVRTFRLKGAYMGQKKPGLTREVFAPNFISTEVYEFGSVFNAEGTEFYYGVDVNGKTEIRYSSRLHGKYWSDPVTIVSHERYGYNDPFLSPDEQCLYFISDQPTDGLGDPKDHDIWYAKREKEGWSVPINAGPNINSEGNEYYISFTEDGSMYFASSVKAPEDRRRSELDIYKSPFANGSFQKAIPLGDAINTPDYEADVFVDPKESYLIFCAIREEGLGMGDLYISFKRPDGAWTEAVNMGEKINTNLHELCPYVSSDGKYLFYTSDEDIYWVSTDIFDELQKK